jgi:hypothetical protein
VERSTIGLMNRQKAKPAGNTINVPRKLLDTVVQRLGLGDKCLIENGGCNITDSEHGANNGNENSTVELDANSVLELFMSLFGGGPVNNNGSGNPQLPGTDAHASSAQNFGRVYSIDSDTNSLGSSSSPEHMTKESSKDSHRDSHGSNGHHHSAAAATAHSVFRHASHQTASSKSAVSLPNNDGTISLHRSDSRSAQDSSSQLGGRVPVAVMEQRDRSGTDDAHGMQVDSPDDRKDSSDTTISLDTTPTTNNRELTVRPDASYQKLVLQDVNGHRDDGPEVPPSPGSNATARLADALQKLRQVNPRVGFMSCSVVVERCGV